MSDIFKAREAVWERAAALLELVDIDRVDAVLDALEGGSGYDKRLRDTMMIAAAIASGAKLEELTARDVASMAASIYDAVGAEVEHRANLEWEAEQKKKKRKEEGEESGLINELVAPLKFLHSDEKPA